MEETKEGGHIHRPCGVAIVGHAEHDGPSPAAVAGCAGLQTEGAGEQAAGAAGAGGHMADALRKLREFGRAPGVDAGGPEPADGCQYVPDAFYPILKAIAEVERSRPGS